VIILCAVVIIFAGGGKKDLKTGFGQKTGVRAAIVKKSEGFAWGR
jgi:hypothetical protein